jgi:hypothetical protein
VLADGSGACVGLLAGMAGSPTAAGRGPRPLPVSVTSLLGRERVQDSVAAADRHQFRYEVAMR